ncbi:MAG: hypothetical protein MI867_21285 [Pseudomonadales bacterium]|nr:hypothetical protein [Pseudomonadales bacterium]
MLYTKIDRENKLAVLEADGPLTKEGFIDSAKQFNEYNSENGLLKGLIIYTEKFPGWGSIIDA